MAERDEEMIRGTVQSIVFQNAENGYTVLRLRTEGGDQITVTGTIPMTLVGERLVIAGKWGRHPSHGPQFEAEFLERLGPTTGNSHPPTGSNTQFGYLHSYTRSSPHDNDSFCGRLHNKKV